MHSMARMALESVPIIPVRNINFVIKKLIIFFLDFFLIPHSIFTFETKKRSGGWGEEIPASYFNAAF